MFVLPPPDPVIVTVNVPGVLCGLAVNFSVEVSEPEMDDGLNVTITPNGRPLADNAIDELKPPVKLALMVVVALLLCCTETEEGDADRVKLAEGAAVTVSETVVVCVTPPPVPVTVMVWVPVAAVEATEIFMVEVPDPGAEIDVGLKLTVTPVG